MTIDEQDSDYMVWKLYNKYKLCWGLDINFTRTEQLVIGLDGNGIVINLFVIKNCKKCRYLVSVLKVVTSCANIDNNINQGRRAIG